MSHAVEIVARPESLLRRQEVQARTSLSRSQLYQLIKDKRFPAPIQLSVRTVAWVQSEIDAWVTSRIQATRKAA
ncbi:MAG: AlpA family phage regulatory protein [Nevskia sp.]|nr:AlpA family phage regulatory protein [Nevskia sp.]